MRKWAPVCWDNYCRPIAKGGLGIHNLLHLNNAFLLKLGIKLLYDVLDSSSEKQI